MSDQSRAYLETLIGHKITVKPIFGRHRTGTVTETDQHGFIIRGGIGGLTQIRYREVSSIKDHGPEGTP